MTDKIPIKFTKPFGNRFAGETSARTPEKARELYDRGVIADPFTTAPTAPDQDKQVDSPADKSDADTREELEEMADANRIRNALESDDYNTMRAAVADLSDEPATGSKPKMRSILESMLEG